MTAPPTAPVPRRRRHGAELETAILEACWDELADSGYANLTMDSVARRAGTSEPVLYRRWSNKDELVLAALERHNADHIPELPDTGSLRGDLIAALTAMGASRSKFFAVAVATVFSGLAARLGLSPIEVRDLVFGDQRESRVRTLFERAEARGEIDLRRIEPDVLSLPFDLVRHDLIMTPGPISADRVTAIVDRLFLPLIAEQGARPAKS
ncbi:TetR/AcrR family transcriptional regulator [Microbacterium sp.]|uniref:TetR/AcrR family transcriptional regulator n=1 Tax=Microbacterium sp. TaxID=51671 RepID=UPI003C764E94